MTTKENTAVKYLIYSAALWECWRNKPPYPDANNDYWRYMEDITRIHDKNYVYCHWTQYKSCPYYIMWEKLYREYQTFLRRYKREHNDEPRCLEAWRSAVTAKRGADKTTASTYFLIQGNQEDSDKQNPFDVLTERLRDQALRKHIRDSYATPHSRFSTVTDDEMCSEEADSNYSLTSASEASVTSDKSTSTPPESTAALTPSIIDVTYPYLYKLAILKHQQAIELAFLKELEEIHRNRYQRYQSAMEEMLTCTTMGDLMNAAAPPGVNITEGFGPEIWEPIPAIACPVTRWHPEMQVLKNSITAAYNRREAINKTIEVQRCHLKETYALKKEEIGQQVEKVMRKRPRHNTSNMMLNLE